MNEEKNGIDFTLCKRFTGEIPMKVNVYVKIGDQFWQLEILPSNGDDIEYLFDNILSFEEIDKLVDDDGRLKFDVLVG